MEKKMALPATLPDRAAAARGGTAFPYRGIFAAVLLVVLITIAFGFFEIKPLAFLLVFPSVLFAVFVLRATSFDYADAFRPGNFPLIYFVLNLIVAPFVHCLTGEFTVAFRGDMETVLNKTLLVHLASFAAFVIGFQVARARFEPAGSAAGPAPDAACLRKRAPLIFAWALTGLISLYLLFGGFAEYVEHFRDIGNRLARFESGTGRYMIGLSFLPVAMGFVFLSVLPKLGARAGALLLLITSVAAAPLLSYTGSRGATVNYIIALLIVFSRFKRRIPFAVACAVALPVLLACILFGLVRSDTDIAGLDDILSLSSSAVADDFDPSAFLLAEVARFDVSAAMIDYVDRTGKLRYGATFLSAPLKLVPTSVHAREGRGGGTELLGEALYGPGKRAMMSTKACPLAAELYGNFHLPGVILGFLLVGVFWGLLDGFYFRLRSHAGVWLLATAATLAYFMFSVSFDLFFQRCALMTAPIVLFMAIEWVAGYARGTGGAAGRV